MQGKSNNLTLSEAARLAMESQLNQGLSTAQKASRLIRTLSGESLESSQIDSKSSLSTERKPLENSAQQSQPMSEGQNVPQSMSESVQALMEEFSLSREEAERLMDIT
jgi:hypothetical protein